MSLGLLLGLGGIGCPNSSEFPWMACRSKVPLTVQSETVQVWATYPILTLDYLPQTYFAVKSNGKAEQRERCKHCVSSCSPVRISGQGGTLHAERDPAALTHAVTVMFPYFPLANHRQKDELSSNMRNHESAVFGTVQPSTCSGVTLSRPWDIQELDWMSRSSGQIASYFSCWPNSSSQ